MSLLLWKGSVRPIFLQKQLHAFVYRTLLSDSFSKLEQYKRQRIFRYDALQHSGNGNGKDELFKSLEDISSGVEARTNITKLLDAMHCSDNVDDCRIIENVLKFLISSKTNSGEHEVSFGFGASVMRMYHYLGLPNEAVAAYKNQDLTGLFKDNTCHLILMDLLYKHGQYSKVLDVYFCMKKFNLETTTLAFGALYHLNTLDSLNKSQALLIHVATNYAISRRAVQFVAMHALNQDDPTRALETLKFCKPDTIVDNITLRCHCKLKEVKRVLSALSHMQHQTNDISQLWNLRIYKDTWDDVQLTIDANGSQKDQEVFDKLSDNLQKRGVLSPCTTESFLDRILPGDADFRKERAKRILDRIPSKPP